MLEFLLCSQRKSRIASFVKSAPLLLLFFLASLNVYAQSISERTLNFAVFVKEDVTLTKHEIEAAVAVGGNLTVGPNNYQIAPPTATTSSLFKVGGIPIGLAVRGDVNFQGGELKIDNKTYVKIGNIKGTTGINVNYVEGGFTVTRGGHSGRIKINTNPNGFTPPVSAQVNPVMENVFGDGVGKINIDAAFEAFEAMSAQFATLPVNVTRIRNMDNPSQFKEVTSIFDDISFFSFKPVFLLTPNTRNVMRVTAEVWSYLYDKDIRFEGMSDNENFELIINIEGADNKLVRFPNSTSLKDNKGRVLYNFPGATGWINLKPNSELVGLVFAPKAHVTKLEAANLVGQVIARAFTHDGDEIHYVPYKPKESCSGETLLTGVVTKQGSPLASVPVVLIPKNVATDTLYSFTNQNGQYQFKGVPEGQYVVYVQDQGLVLRDRLAPVITNNYDVQLVNCQWKVRDFDYEPTLRPAIGDFVWLDINKDSQQNEWFDANDDGKITQNFIDIANFETLNRNDWEWVDLNGDGRWDGPENEGELNKAGIWGTPPFANIRVTGPNGYNKTIVIGPDGYWWDLPTHIVNGVEEGLFGTFTATLEIDPTFTANALQLGNTRKVKEFDSNGNAVEPSTRRSARTAAVKELELVTHSQLFISGSVTPQDPVNLTLDLNVSVQEKEDPLPVSLVSFNSSWNPGEKQVDLLWRTSEEINSYGFEVQHSTNGLLWNTIGFVNSKGNGAEYRFPHTDALAGRNYYRLKMLDLDGKSELSHITSLIVERRGLTEVWPNPAVDYVRISGRSQTSTIKEIVVLNALGNTVRKIDTSTSEVNVSGLLPGLYHLRISYQDGTSESVKVLKK